MSKQKAVSVEDRTGDAMKRPKEKLPFKSKMWSYINDLIDPKGESSSSFNDMLIFERHFEEWDNDGILLLELSYGNSNSIPYVDIKPVGVFTNLNNLGRRLQSIFTFREYTDISVMLTGEELDFNVKVGCVTYKTYNARFIEIDQRESDRHYDGLKYEILDYNFTVMREQMERIHDYVTNHIVDADISLTDAVNHVIDKLSQYTAMEDGMKSPGAVDTRDTPFTTQP